jgi:hypothetical protein
MRRAARILFIASALLAGACSPDSSAVAPPTEANVVGSYNLSIINGGSLPFPYSANTTSRFDIVGGRITLTADHAFTDVLTTRETILEGNVARDAQTDTQTGTWSLDGSNLTMVYTGHPVGQVAVVTGTLLTRVDLGLSLTYSK